MIPILLMAAPETRLWPIAVCALLAVAGLRAGVVRGQRTPVSRSVAFLSTEVPKWHAEQSCFSCHNNGDAARALILASTAGYDVAAPLADTLRFLSAPPDWERNSTGGAFDDVALARVQFAGALTTAVEAGLAPVAALAEAGRLLVTDQQPDGSWQLDPSNSLGSPATYGTALATWSARRTLVASGREEFAPAIARADGWLRTASVRVTPDAAAVAMALAGTDDEVGRRQLEAAVGFLLDTQGPDGGWGAFPNVRSEPFDTAVAVLAVAARPPTDTTRSAVARGRTYLLNTMLDDGSWLETTRPAGQRSYAQLISTTGWATLALLKTVPGEAPGQSRKPRPPRRTR
jgi:hypothetical protein